MICYDGQNNLCDFKFLSIHILNPRQKSECRCCQIFSQPACLLLTAMCVQVRASRAGTPAPSSRAGPRCITPPPREITTLSDSCSRKVTPPLPAPHRSQPTVLTHLIISYISWSGANQQLYILYLESRCLISLTEENNGIVERCPCLSLAAYTYLCNCNISLLLLMTSGPLTPDLCCRRECGGRRGGG